MKISSVPDEATRVAVYVDGFNLYHGMRQRYGRRYLWLDLETLAYSLLLHGQVLVAVHYFTALVRDDPAGGQRQQLYLDALATRPLVKVHHGRFQRKMMHCRRCGRQWRSYEEKETDVAIAARLVADTAERLMDTALLVTADSDMVPAVHQARRLSPSLNVIVGFPPDRSSGDLASHVDGSFTVPRTGLRDSQLPEPVRSGDVEFSRPKHWS